MATMGRPRIFTSPERKARNKASRKAWAERNRAYVRMQINALGSRPEYLERRRYLRRRAALAAAARSDETLDETQMFGMLNTHQR